MRQNLDFHTDVPHTSLTCDHMMNHLQLPLTLIPWKKYIFKKDNVCFQMGALDSTEWELFLRKMIARNLRIFGAPDPVRSAYNFQFCFNQS